MLNGRGYKYALPAGTSKGDLNRSKDFEDYVRGVDFSGNLIND